MIHSSITAHSTHRLYQTKINEDLPPIDTDPLKKKWALIIISANAWKVGWVENETQQIQNVGFHFVQPNLHGGPVVQGFYF
jgi:hypothetical protein